MNEVINTYDECYKWAARHYVVNLFNGKAFFLFIILGPVAYFDYNFSCSHQRVVSLGSWIMRFSRRELVGIIPDASDCADSQLIASSSFPLHVSLFTVFKGE